MDSKSKNAHTKSQQFEILINFMVEHSELAKGQLKTACAKSAANNLWKRLSEEMNAAGPPLRDVVGWKKVWADYKNHLKTKMRRNKINISSTGGGASSFCPLTAMEEQVLQLMEMDEAVSGTIGSLRFGDDDSVGEQSTLELSEPNKNVDTNSAEEYVVPSSKKRQRLTAPNARDNLLQQQVKNQIVYQEGSLKKLDEISSYLKEIAEQLKISNELEERKINLTQKQFFNEEGLKQNKNNKGP